MPQIEKKSKKDESHNEDVNKEAVDKEHFKAVAKQKFDAVLKHEINNRRNNCEINSRANEGSSQFFRIENSQIFSINEASHKAEIRKESTKFNSKFSFNNSESARNNQLAKANKDDGHVFIYDPLLISCDSLNYISAEQHKISSSSKQVTSFEEEKESVIDPYPETIFRCYLCPYFHVKEMMIARHWIQTHLTQNVYTCPYCQSDFLTNYLTMRHIMEAHEGQPVQVEIKRSNQFAVKLAFEQNYSYLLRSEKMQIDKGKGQDVNMKCHRCNLECKSLVDLEAHHKHVHIHFRPYSCGMCNSRVCFATRIDLDHHIKITHPYLVKEATILQDQEELKKGEAEVKIDWSEACIINERGKTLRCKWCDFQTINTSEICQHVLKIHLWSKSIKCPTCNMLHEMEGEHYIIGQILCCGCSTLIKLIHDMKGNSLLSSSVRLYKCKSCKYSTHSKGSISRHIKYSHSNCRPYGCPYCEYTAVEKPKVRSHIMSLHRDKEVKTIEETESHQAFKKNFHALYKRYVTMEYVELHKNAYSGELKITGSNQNQKTSFECSTCKFTSDSSNCIEKHVKSIHKDDTVVAEIRELNLPAGEHFKCISCSYRCYDRSCMARHVKYKHLTSRPHQCPHCNYENVEKTKVRLHISSNHPNFGKGVKTNHHLLEQMSLEAKKFYVRVDANGKELTDNGCNFPSDWKQHRKSPPIRMTSTVQEKKSSDVVFDGVNGECKDLVVATNIEENSVKTISDREDEEMESLSDVAESMDEEYMIDLNDNFDDMICSDEDNMMSVEQETCNKTTKCVNNLIVDDAVLEDPKISLKVPKVYLKDYVNIKDDLESLFKNV